MPESHTDLRLSYDPQSDVYQLWARNSAVSEEVPVTTISPSQLLVLQRDIEKVTSFRRQTRKMSYAH